MATAAPPIDWDAALVRALPAVEAAASDEDYRKAIAGLLAELHDPVTRVAGPEKAAPTPNVTPLATRLDALHATTAVLSIPNDPSLESNPSLRGELCARFGEAARFESLVVDLRSPFGRPPGFALTDAIAKCTARLLDRDLTLAPARFLTHGFYPMQSLTGGAGGGVGFWESGLQVVSSGSLRSEGARAPRLVFIVGPGTADLFPLLMALQAQGSARVVQEGELPEAGVMASTLEIDAGLTVRLRHGEWLRPDGGAGFRADAVVPAGNGDAARERALALLEEPPSPAAGPGPVSQAYRYDAFLEKDYSESPYPDREHRLLALFRLFAVIEHFYPYRNLMDRPWAETFVAFIPRMSAARDATDYALTVAELATRIQDSHVTLASPVLDAYFGTHRPAVRVDLIEGQTVVTEVAPELAPSGLRVGDIVVSVDGETTAARRARLARYLPASTPGRLENKIDVQFLLGPETQPAEIEVRGEDGGLRRASAPRALEGLAPRSRTRTGPAYAVLPAGYGYVDLQALTAAQVDAAFEAIKATPGAIFDMRGYPGRGARELIPRLGPPHARARALGGTPHYDGGSGSFALEESFWTDDDAEPPERYSGRVVVLADGSSQSAAEYVCQLIKSVVDATFVGSRTSGANGAVTRTILPGGIVVNFTGQSVKNADGSQLQRVGIVPDLPSQPTLAGVRAGRDEVLERAVSFLSGGR
jgi:C-terminal processing protease CtpA/Prc